MPFSLYLIAYLGVMKVTHSNACLRPEIGWWYVRSPCPIPSGREQPSAPRMAVNAEIRIPTWPNYSSLSREVIYPDFLKKKIPSVCSLATYFSVLKKKKTHSNDPNKHICRADLRGLACRSQSATSAPLVLFVSDSHHNFCFFQELFLSLNRYLSPTSMAFPGPVVFLKDIQESHSFLKEYERGHIKEGFLELSKWSQGKHQENLFLIAQLLNCQRLLFGNTHECKSSSKALNFTTIVVMTSVFQSTKCQTKPSSALSNRQCLPTTTYPRRW